MVLSLSLEVVVLFSNSFHYFADPAFGYISKVDILVCTAGRLVDHIKHTKGFDLHHLRFLVIDEADRVLETIQNDWLYHLENHIQRSSKPKIFLFLRCGFLKQNNFRC